MTLGELRRLVRQMMQRGAATQAMTAGSVFEPIDSRRWYAPVLLGASTVGARAWSADCVRQVLGILEQLEPDDYSRYIVAYCKTALERYGDSWRYADILSGLRAAAELVRPQSYLEIGVRRGRSAAVVAATAPDCEIVGFDLWQQDYAGMTNPGPDFVRRELARVGHRGRLTLVSGDSHRTVPRYFAEHRDASFDVITVDGDHSERGAEQDLRDVLPRLKVGGVLVFDDVAHPEFPRLRHVWRDVVANDPRFDCWEYGELGFGVALAVRRR